MRDPNTKQVQRRRNCRRAALIAAILVATPALAADPPSSTSLRILPPLPLQSSATHSSIQTNPFCQPANQSGKRAPVQLASGKKQPTIRLKPIGAAIGLHPIQEAGAPSEAQAMVVDAPLPTPIKTNPLVGSQHHVNNDLVETEVDVANQSRSLFAPQPVDPCRNASEGPSESGSHVRVQPATTVNPHAAQCVKPEPRSSIILIPPTAQVAQQLNQPAVEPSLPVLAESTAPEASLLPSPAPTVVSAPQADIVESVSISDQANGAVEEEVSAVDSDPITFSISDFSGEPKASPKIESGDQFVAEAADLLEVTDRQQSVDPATPTLSPSENIGHTPEELAPIVRPHQPVLLVEPLVIEGDLPELTPVPEPVVELEPERADESQPALTRAPQPAVVGIPAPVVVDEQPELAPPPVAAADSRREAAAPILQSEAPTVIYRDEPAVSSAMERSEPTLHDKRYRPPVAVTPLPLALERPTAEAQASIVRPTVQPVQAPRLDDVVLEQAAGAKLTPLYMSRAQVRSLTLGGRVRKVKVGDKNICQAFTSSPNELKLIGTGNGVTQLVVWADTDDNAPTRVRAFEIHVQDAVAATGKTSVDRTEMLNRSIRKMFPGCQVTVRRVAQQLVVAGSCDSDASAKQILRMVRKTCLVPVRDELQIASSR